MMKFRIADYAGMAPYRNGLSSMVLVFAFGCIITVTGVFDARADSGETESGETESGVVSGRKPTPAEQKRYMQLFTQGNAFLYKAEYVPAIAHFLSAIKIAPDLPGAWRQLGLAYEGQKRYEDAINSYARYLSIVGGVGKYSTQVMIRINVCLEELGLPPRQFKGLFKGRPGIVEIKTSTVRAEIRINNVRRDRTPSKPLPLKPGLHTLTLSKRGYIPWSTTLVVHPGERIVVEADLVKDPNYVPEPPVKHVKPGPAPEPTKGLLRVDVSAARYRIKLNGVELKKNEKGMYELEPGRWVVDVTSPGRIPWKGVMEIQKGRQRVVDVSLAVEADRERFNTWAWISLGAATAFGGVGMVFGLLQNRAYRKIRDDDSLSESALRDWEDRRKTYGAVAWSGYGMGAAALISSAVLFILKRRVESLPLQTGSIAVSPMGDGVGLSYSGEVNLP